MNAVEPDRSGGSDGSGGETPPDWAELLLRLVLVRKDRDAVSGDLLEAYRDTMVPTRGHAAADAWYVRQVAGFLWRATWPWALLFSGQFIARGAYDMLVPTTDFHVRAEWSTYVGASTFLLVGLWAAWRTGSLLAGIVVTAITSQVAAVFSVVGVSLLLVIMHDAETMRLISRSGGLGEAYFLPFMMIIPALVIGMVAGAVGSLTRRIARGTA